jgi:hypothetical protein
VQVVIATDVASRGLDVKVCARAAVTGVLCGRLLSMY